MIYHNTGSHNCIPSTYHNNYNYVNKLLYRNTSGAITGIDTAKHNIIAAPLHQAAVDVISFVVETSIEITAEV